METEEISYTRQKALFNPVYQKFKIIVFGAGSLGSVITLSLAKLGFSDISVYDFDIVEKQNIPNQMYRLKDLNELKVEALAEIVKEFSGIDIKCHNEKVTNKSNIEKPLNAIYIVTFDSLEQRKIIFDLLKDSFGGYVMDVRMGGEQYDIRSIDLTKDEDINFWEKSFGVVTNNLPCGEKSIIYTNFSVAGEVANIAKKINNGSEYPIKLLRHMKNYVILNG